MQELRIFDECLTQWGGYALVYITPSYKPDWPHAKQYFIAWAVVRFYNIKLKTGRHNTNQQLATCSVVQLNKSVYWHHHCLINVTRVTRHLLNFCLLHRAVDVLNSKPWLPQRMITKRVGRKQVFCYRFVALTLATELC